VCGLDEKRAAPFAALGVPSFAGTPGKFPELISAAIPGRDVGQWSQN
jgi:hypothetical protein